MLWCKASGTKRKLLLEKTEQVRRKYLRVRYGMRKNKSGVKNAPERGYPTRICNNECNTWTR